MPVNFIRFKLCTIVSFIDKIWLSTSGSSQSKSNYLTFLSFFLIKLLFHLCNLHYIECFSKDAVVLLFSAYKVVGVVERIIRRNKIFVYKRIPVNRILAKDINFSLILLAPSVLWGRNIHVTANKHNSTWKENTTNINKYFGYGGEVHVI